jgi:hypothetical protein
LKVPRHSAVRPVVESAPEHEDEACGPCINLRPTEIIMKLAKPKPSLTSTGGHSRSGDDAVYISHSASSIADLLVWQSKNRIQLAETKKKLKIYHFDRFDTTQIVAHLSLIA